MIKYIWIKKKKYYHYDTYKTWEKAKKKAKWHKKKNKCKYFILETEDGLWFPVKNYRLYLDKCIRLW